MQAQYCRTINAADSSKSATSAGKANTSLAKTPVRTLEQWDIYCANQEGVFAGALRLGGIEAVPCSQAISDCARGSRRIFQACGCESRLFQFAHQSECG